MAKWYDDVAQENIVLFSRVSFYRNFKGFEFTLDISDDDIERIIQEVRDLCNSDSIKMPYNKLYRIDIEDFDKNLVLSLFEKNIIDLNFLKTTKKKAVFVSEDESVCVTVNNLEHIKLSGVCRGNITGELLEKVQKIDKALEQKLPYLYDPDKGYLGKGLQNIGIGMKAQVVLHLPALESVGQIKRIATSASKLGFLLTGFVDDKQNGSFYKLINQVSLDISEEVAVQNLYLLAKQIAKQELDARKTLDRYDLEDKVFRAYGLLKYARLVSRTELIELLSFMILGAEQKIFDNIEVEKILETIFNSGDYTILLSFDEKLDQTQINRIRATLVRNMFVKI